MTDEVGRPITITVFADNTADPKAFSDAVTKVRERLCLETITFVGDRGMITGARARELSAIEHVTFITALRASQIKGIIRKELYSSPFLWNQT
jgi:transposase